MNNLLFTNFDYLVIGVMVFSCVFAYFRGLVREILSLIAWIGAGIVTIYYFQSATQHLETHFRSRAVAGAIAGVGIYTFALLGFAIINIMILNSFKSTKEPGMLDNMLGLGFGACRGALIISLAYFLISVAIPNKNDYPDWLKNAVFRPSAAQGSALLARVAPEYLFEISSLERKAEGEPPASPPVSKAVPADTQAPAPVTRSAAPVPPPSADADNPANNAPGENTGYNQTTTKQLDRLIDSTGNQ